MTDEKYNGWTNYETWNVNLWLTSNDEATYQFFNDKALEIYNQVEKTEYFSKLERATFDLSDFIQEYIEEHNPLNDESSLYADILRSNLTRSAVNYYEIARGLIDSLEE